MEKIIQDLISRCNEIYYVDSRIIIKLMLTYFEKKENQILLLFSQLLHMNENEKKIFENCTIQLNNKILLNENKNSLSELWIQFLMKD
jgi:hypothetical protein